MAASPASVVLVEDSVSYAGLVAHLLAQAMPEGVEVRQHERLAPALDDLRERPADCVLLDLGLPDAEGLDGLRALQDAGISAPVVVLSGHDDDDLALAAIQAGAQDYLVKGREHPPDAFLRAIRFAIERRRAQERAEDRLRAREDRWRTLTHLAPVGILETDPDGRCIFLNDRAAELVGRAPEAVLGDGWRDAIDPAERAGFDAAWAAAAATAEGELAVEVRFAAGRWVHVTAVQQRDPWDRPAGWLATLVDVTPARQARDDLRDLASTDPLTGLGNRRLWDERVSVELARAARSGRPVCVAALDLDHFKAYNDRHGHQAGDRLLSDTAAAWRRELRVSDLLVRLGGDEFAVLLPDCDVGGARAMAERLRDVTPTPIGCSAGVVCHAAGEEPAALLARADAALYAAKAAGRGRIADG